MARILARTELLGLAAGTLALLPASGGCRDHTIIEVDGQVIFTDGGSLSAESGAGGSAIQEGGPGSGGQGGSIEDSGQTGAAGSSGQGGGIDDSGGQAGSAGSSGQGDIDDSGQAGAAGSSGQGDSGSSDGDASASGFDDSGVPLSDASGNEGAVSSTFLSAIALSTGEEEITAATGCGAYGSHSCAVRADGAVVCWGANGSGQLGNGTLIDNPKPVMVLGIGRAIQVATGALHSCARLEDGTVWCWGSNTGARLGLPSSSSSSEVPVMVPGITHAVSVSSAIGHSCALLEDGTVVCWGTMNMESGLTTVQPPRAMATEAVMVSTGGGEMLAGQYTCAIRSDRSVVCWGGDGPNDTLLGVLPAATPTALRIVEGVSDAIAIASGGRHACAVQTDGSVSCWGANTAGQLGDGTTDPHAAASVPGVTGAIGVAAGRSHTCALLSQGSVLCWGSNSRGQLGDGTRDDRTTPVAVSGLSRATAISAAGQHTCALIDDNSVQCWGYNDSGALGDGTAIDSAVPVTVVNIDNPSPCAIPQSVSAGADHSCAVFNDGTVRCWGSNALGQLGNSTPADTATPTVVPGVSPAIGISAGQGFTCALIADRTVRCWGGGLKSSSGFATCQLHSITGVSQAVAIAAGYDHACALTQGGSVQCWGNRELGALGVPPSGYEMVSNLNIPGGTAVSADLHHSCAGRANGWVMCWGAASNLEATTAITLLGVTTTESPSTITQSAAATTIQSIAAIGNSICAAGDNRVSCVGPLAYLGGRQATSSECSMNFSRYWSTVTSGVAVTAGSSHYCALQNDGAVVCWAGTDQTRGCQSAPDPLPPLPLPEPPSPMGSSCVAGLPPCRVGLPAKALQVSAGSTHSCALLENRSIVCWGDNSHGQLGGVVNGTSTMETTSFGAACQK